LVRTGLGIFTAAGALVASTLCLHAAISQQTSAGTNELKAAGLHSADLSPEFDSARAPKLKLRLLTLEPGGVIQLHSHKDHPTILRVIKGTLTSHPQGMVLRAGVGFAEGPDSNYWVQNTGDEPAEFIWLPYEPTP
jgi:quercetin dioxygenase-like cupin family protein